MLVSAFRSMREPESEQHPTGLELPVFCSCRLHCRAAGCSYGLTPTRNEAVGALSSPEKSATQDLECPSSASNRGWQTAASLLATAKQDGCLLALQSTKAYRF